MHFATPITVAELIAKLQELDPTLPVFRNDGEWGPQPVSGEDLKLEPAEYDIASGDLLEPVEVPTALVIG